MGDRVLVLSDEPVNVRDSWDILDTPRTSHSETDEMVSEQSRSNSKRQHRKNCVAWPKVRQRSEERDQLEKNKSTRNSCSRVQTGRYQSYSDRELRRAADISPLTSEPIYQSRPVGAGSFTSTSKVIPRRYRKMGLRNHDDMLQEQFAKLRHLLSDSENMRKEELNKKHAEQTSNMIANYKAVNGGAKTRGIIISRSLPESLRPKSPRSSSSRSSFSSSQTSQTFRSTSSSRSPSPSSRRSSKKVSFEVSPLRKNNRARKTTPSHWSSKAINTLSDSDSEAYRPTMTPIDIPSKEAVHHHRHSDTSESEESEYQETSSTTVKRQSARHYGRPTGSQRGDYREQQPQKNREQKERTLKRQSQKANTIDVKDYLHTASYGHQDRQVSYGVYEDHFGHKHSDNNLKRTSNPDIKRWLKEKNKSLKEAKKKQRQLRVQEEEVKELETQKQKERKLESEKQLRAWQASKRKEARLRRKKIVAKQKAEKQSMSASENNLSQHEPSTINQRAQKVPAAPAMPRPQSAPPSRRRVTKPAQVPIEEVIKNSPDLRDKLRVLEKQKTLKHRQSYDEWVKSKEEEKRNTLKVIREQRQKLEKEISEETAKVISEAARRRNNNIPYKGSTATQAKKEPKKGDITKEEDPKPQPYTWTKEKETNTTRVPNPRAKRFTAQRTAPVPIQRRSQSTKPGGSKPLIEDTVNPEASSNPFTDPFKPPKLRRPKSKLEQSGTNGPEFSRFIWDLVNEQENGGNRPEPQGADSPQKASEPPAPEQSKSPTPPASRNIPTTELNEPVIENGRTIFSMTSIE